jgi:hypothetical protein
VLANLTAESFRPHQGTVFVLEVGPATTADLALVEVRATGVEAFKGGPTPPRPPFALTFRGPLAPIYAQRTYRLRHPAMGELELFLVPIGRSAAGADYEACFT